MSQFKRHIRLLALSLALPATLLAYSNIAQADPHFDHHGGSGFEHRGDWHGGPHFRPGIGISVDFLPPHPRLVAYGRDRFFFSGGVWYRPFGPRFVVVAPPFGLVIPFLPDYYDTRVISGDTYYVSDDVYYHVNPSGDGYVVTAPPNDSGAVTTAPAPADKMFVYPRSGQSQKQQDKDSYECHSWATGQSGFDPTLAHGGVSGDQVNAKGTEYRRAMEACMDGRGYTVK